MAGMGGMGGMGMVPGMMGQGAAAPAPRVGTRDEMIDLQECVDVSKSSVLNNDKATYVSSVLGAGTGLLKSDCDEQLLIFVPFTETVKIHDFVFKADAPDSKEDVSAPKSVKVWVNRLNMDFSDTDAVNPTHTFDLTPEDLTGRRLPVKFTKFQSVVSLTIFVETNQDDEDVSFLNKIGFIGQKIAGTNMSDLKKTG